LTQELYKRRRSFWQSAARLTKTSGVIQVVTYNGVVTLRSQEQARRFGRKLYQHLSKGGKVEVTAELLRRLFEERKEAALRDETPSMRIRHARDIAQVTSFNGPIYDESQDEVRYTSNSSLLCPPRCEAVVRVCRRKRRSFGASR
jgi:ribosomal protein L29